MIFQYLYYGPHIIEREIAIKYDLLYRNYFT